MKLKRCRVCDCTLPISDFYANSTSADGLAEKCKECHKAAMRKNQVVNRERIRRYEAVRALQPDRKQRVLTARKLRKAANPDKFRARDAVNNALRDGRLKKLPCQVCGNPKSEAHHADYSKPLEVKWLCFRCHREQEHGQRVGD